MGLKPSFPKGTESRAAALIGSSAQSSMRAFQLLLNPLAKLNIERCVEKIFIYSLASEVRAFEYSKSHFK